MGLERRDHAPLTEQTPTDDHVWPPPPQRPPREAAPTEPRTEPVRWLVSAQLLGLISVCLGGAGWLLLAAALLFHIPLYPLKGTLMLLALGGMLAARGKTRLAEAGSQISLLLAGLACGVIEVLHIAREL